MVQLVWQGNLFDVTGYAKASRQYVLALHQHGIDVKVEAFQAHMPEVELPEEQHQILKHLVSKRRSSHHRIFISHFIPDYWHRKLNTAIGFTYWETSRIPSQWVTKANQMNAVFLPSSNNVEVFRQSGVNVPLFHIRPCLHPPLTPSTDEHVPPYLRTLPPFRFLAVCSWIERKGIDTLLQAFWREFSADDPVALVIKTTGSHDLLQVVEGMKRDYGITHHTAPVHIDLHMHSELGMDALYRNCHAFVHPSRGEGVGYPILEAAVRGLPIISTGWGGHMDYLNSFNSYPIPFRLVPVKPQPYYYGYQSDQLWAEASIEDLQRLMREVLNHYEQAKFKAIAAQYNALEHFTPQRAAQDMVSALRTLTRYRSFS